MDFRRLSLAGLVLIAMALSFGCSDDEDLEYVLVWSDEFDGAAGESPDPAKWTFDLGDGCPNLCGWGNNELQTYTDRPENVSMDGEGHLVITARRETLNDRDYTSARIRTEGLFTQQYGRFEARMKLPRGQGLWPAFWMLGDDIRSVGWPDCGEIDIMEYRGQETDVVQGTVHGPGYSGGNSIGERYVLANADFDAGFHVFAIEWTDSRITWFVDGQAYFRVRPQDLGNRDWVFDHPFFLIMNVAVGGNFVGPVGANVQFPQTMIIDWVRVYEAL